jgi:predicted transcriptional regulator/transcriptional regulator with XRE-family HTH domain
MSDSRPLFLGPRLRRLRRELGLTQAAMAEDLGISPSYVALIEHNQRPVTADLLLRIARGYRLDLGELAGDDGADIARRLTELLRDPVFAEIDLPALEVADLAASFPGVSEALVRLYGAYTRAQAALAEAGSGDNAAPEPVTEARRFIGSRRNFFASLDARAEALAEAVAEAGDGTAYLARTHGIRTRVLPAQVMMGSLRRFDRHNQQLLLDEGLDAASRQFHIALQIAYTDCRADLAALLREAAPASPTTSNLLRRQLAGYAAAALLMPYARFGRAAEELGYDVEALARRFGTSFEQTAHRLTTLGKPGAEGVPFFFIRLDAAGNVSKRLDGAGFPFAAHGGGCPLWSVHQLFGRAPQIVTQWLELPEGQRFFSLARVVRSGGGSWNRAPAERAVALACAAEHAPRLVYARGQEPARAVATPIGVNCRLCTRANCEARALPPIGREILPDDYRRTAAPFTFSDG